MKEKYYWYIFILLTATYVATVLLIPPDPHVLARYHLSLMQAVLINVSVLIPLVAIWTVAFYGFIHLRRYANTVQSTPEGVAFGWMAAGLAFSVLGLPLTSTINSLMNHYALFHPGWLPTATVIRNYSAVVLALITFYPVGRSAEALVRRLRKKPPLLHHQLWFVASIAISSIFTWLVVTHHANGGRDTTYYMPDWLVVSTIVVPYLYAWYRGSVATYCIYFYQKNVKGTIYRQALSYFSAGIAVVIGASVFIQSVMMYGERVNRLNLTPVLAIIYALLILWAVGYGLIAKGTKKLKTIEDV